MASSAGRGFVRVGRRCQMPGPAAVPLVHLGLGSRHAAAAAAAATQPNTTVVVVNTARAYTRYAATNAPRVTCGWGRGVAGAGLETRRAFSTSPAETGGEGKVDTDSGVSGGSEAGAKAGDIPAPTLPDEENPLAGFVADDGDPGPPPPLDPSIVTEPSEKVLEVMKGIDSLNFMELAMLVDLFKNKLGLDEVPTLNYGGKGGEGSGEEGGAGAAEAPAEKTLWKVKVTGFGEKAKIKVIKEVRAITGLGLREAKEVVESLPQVVKEDLKPEEAEAMKGKLEAAGATVEVE